jgi:hypothetical protein
MNKKKEEIKKRIAEIYRVKIKTSKQRRQQQGFKWLLEGIDDFDQILWWVR